MEPPAAAPPIQTHYADSLDSSPRSRNTDSWDDPLPPASRLRLMCSYGGHIVPRPHDKSLCYVGGDTRIVVVDRNTSLADLSNRLAKTLLNNRPFTLKYQLPSEDLDSLISVTTDEDLDNMIDEFDRTASHNSSAKPARIRLFLFPLKPDSSQSMGPLDMPTKSEDWFFNALNGSSEILNRGFSDSASVNCLLGLDDDGGGGGANNSDSRGGDAEASAAANCKNGKPDVHSVPDSPMLENSSSFGSTSSSPSLANLPPIRVHVEDSGGSSHGGNRAQDQKVGIEEQFAQMTVGLVGQQQKQDDSGGFVVLSSPPPLPTTIVPSSAPVSSSSAPDYLNRIVSDDERSDHGGYRKPLPPQPQQQSVPPQSQQQSVPPQSQPKSTGIFDLPSPDSVSSDHSLSNAAISRPKPVIYQEPVAQIPTVTPTRFPANLVDPKVNVSDPNTRVQLQQQVQDSGYVLQAQYDQQLQQQQQLLQQQQLQQQQQFIHPGAHYMHHHPAGSVPIQAYYPVYPSQQQQHQQQQHQQHQQQQHQHQQQQQQQHHHQPQLDQQQQYQVYYMPARQAQAYSNLPLQQPLQSNISEAAAATIASSRSQPPPNPMLSPTAAYSQIRNAPIAKPEIAAGVYRTTTTAAPPSLVQVPPTQHQPQQQYVGYAQVHHPSQSTVPTSTGAANYAYEYADASHAQHAQVYYTQPLAPAMTSQYQTMTAAAAMGLPEVSTQLPNDNIKQQQQQR